MSEPLSITLMLPAMAGSVALAVVTWLLCRIAIRKEYLPADVISRSSHSRLTSRGGGLAMMVPFLLSATAYLLMTGEALTSPAVLLLVLTGGAVLLGWVDDRQGLAPGVKFAGQAGLAVLLVLACGGIETVPLPFAGEVSLGVFGGILAVLWAVAFMNVFNFMDGLNGMAAGTAIIAVIAFLFAGAAAQRADLAVVAILLLGALAGFFVLNFPGGRLFMGDSGSHGLAFLLAGLALTGANGEAEQVEFIFLPVIFLPFIFDVSVTLGRRLLRRAPLHQAHKEHLYQQLHQRGLSHGHVSAIYMGLCLAAAGIAWLTGYAPAGLKWLGPFALVCFMGAGALLILAQPRQGKDTSREEVTENTVSGQSGD